MPPLPPWKIFCRRLCPSHSVQIWFMNTDTRVNYLNLLVYVMKSQSSLRMLSIDAQTKCSLAKKHLR